MNCYAPLLVNVNGRQWRPNLIGYDALHVYGSPSYYAIQLFSRNLGDQILHATLDSAAVDYSVTRDSHSGTVFVKLVNPQPEGQSLDLDLEGTGLIKSTSTAATLAADPGATNTLKDPAHVVPVVARLTASGPSFACTLPANSITVLTLNVRRH